MDAQTNSTIETIYSDDEAALLPDRFDIIGGRIACHLRRAIYVLGRVNTDETEAARMILDAAIRELADGRRHVREPVGNAGEHGPDIGHRRRRRSRAKSQLAERRAAIREILAEANGRTLDLREINILLEQRGIVVQYATTIAGDLAQIGKESAA